MASSGSLKPPSLTNSNVLWASFCSRTLSFGGSFGGFTFSVRPSDSAGSLAGPGSEVVGSPPLPFNALRLATRAEGSGLAAFSRGFGVSRWLSPSIAARRSRRESPRL